MSPLKSKLKAWNKHWLEWTRTLSWILWASGAAGQRTVGVGRGCRLWLQGGGWEEGQIPWASGLDTHVRKTLPRVQRLSPWPCFVWKSHRLSKVGSLSSFRRPSAKVAKAGCSTAYIVTFKAKIDLQPLTYASYWPNSPNARVQGNLESRAPSNM